VQVHAIGDAAIDQALDSFEAFLGKASPLEFPFRLNHVIATRPDQIERLNRVRPACDIQPIQSVSDMDMAPQRLGPTRARTAYAWKTLENLGLLMTGSSDGPVDTANLWISVDAAVNARKTDGSGQCWKQDERLNLDSALRMFTVNPYRAIGQGKRLGRIAAGLPADFAILDADPFSIATEDLHKIRVQTTLAGGLLTWGKCGDLPEMCFDF
jgi:predicted amidohydrolase YtcJ